MKATPRIIYLPDTRGVELSPYGRDNSKIGPNVFTFSRVAGRPRYEVVDGVTGVNVGGTCPGSTNECEAICYAKRITGPVRAIYDGNGGPDVPPIPAECRLLRIHVSGDFDSKDYIGHWCRRLQERPDVTAWAYTRSWRVPHLLESLEYLRAMPNMQLFASMDPSTAELPPVGWRRAWIDRSFDSAIRGRWPMENRLTSNASGRRFSNDNQTVTADGTPSYVCPEETGRKKNCEECRYCFDGQRNDVTFLEH